MTRPRTAVLASTQPMLRAGLAAALRSAGIEVVSEVDSAPDAVAAAERLRPGVCLLDAALPGSTLAAIKRITSATPDTPVIVLGTPGDDEMLIAAVRAGAIGFLPRSTTTSGLARAALSALEGGAAIPRAGVGALVRELRTGSSRRYAVAGSGILLTERERTIVDLLRKGLGPGGIAAELGLSPVTVRRHLGSIKRKAKTDEDGLLHVFRLI